VTERAQRVLWGLVLIVAVGLAGVTVGMYRYSRSVLSAGDASAYELVYVSNRDGDFQLYTCGASGEENRALAGSAFGDILPACSSAVTGSTGPAVAFLRLGGASDDSEQVGMTGSVSVLSRGRREAVTVSGHITRVLAVAPVWSPQGDRIAFGAAEDANADGAFTADEAGIYLAALDGTEPVRVAAGNTEDTRMSWSPAGQQLLVQIRLPGPQEVMARLLDISGGGGLIRRDPYTTVACWSPDGQRIAAYSTADHRIHVLLVDDGTEEYSVSAPAGDVSYLHWRSAGGDKGQLIALVSEHPATWQGRLFMRSVVEDSASSWQLLDPESTEVYYPAVSPDGQWIAYSRPDGTGEVDLMVLAPGGKPTRVTSDGGLDILPCWSPKSAPSRQDAAPR